MMSNQGKGEKDQERLDEGVWDDGEREDEARILEDQQLPSPAEKKTKMPFRGTKLGGPDLGLDETETPQDNKAREQKEKEKTLQLASRGSPPKPDSGLSSSSREEDSSAVNSSSAMVEDQKHAKTPASLAKKIPSLASKGAKDDLQLASRGAAPPASSSNSIHQDEPGVFVAGDSAAIRSGSKRHQSKTLSLASRGSQEEEHLIEQDAAMGGQRGQDTVMVTSTRMQEEEFQQEQDLELGDPNRGHTEDNIIDAENNVAASATEEHDFAVAAAELVQEPPLAIATRKVWWTKQRICAAGAIVIVIVAIAVGVSIAVTRGNDDPSIAPQVEEPLPMLWSQLGQDVDGEAAEDHLGFFQSVSLSRDGTTLAVGARLNDGNGVASGSVRVFRLLQGLWNQTGQDIDGEVMIDQSGVTLDLSDDGTMLAIGSRGNSGNGNLAGHVRVFQLINNEFWLQVGKDIEGNQTLDSFGTSVSLSSDGKTLAAGANQYSDADDRPGYVRVFRLDGSTWNQMGQDLIGENPGDEFGFSVSLSSDGLTIAVGGPSNEENGKGSGHSCVYSFAQDWWDPVGQCIHGREKDEKLSLSLSLSGDGSVIALGAQGSNNGTGHARVYELVSDDWEQIGEDIEGEGQDDRLGSAISLSTDGNVLAVGAAQFGGEGGLPGYAVMFRREEDAWVPIGREIRGEDPNDQFGHSISLAGDSYTVAIGAFLNDGNGENSGHVRVYRQNDAPALSTQTASPATPMPTPSMSLPGTWTQLGQELNGEAPGDQSGFYGALSLSQDGTKVAVGARGNDDGGTGAGHVRVFQLADTSWNQTGQDIDGDAANDQFGRSVSLSPDGLTLAVGAWADVVNGTDAGDVRVYQIVNGTWSQIGQDLQGNATGDQFGVAVSLSSNGRILAVGANQNADSPGYVRVFRLEGATWSQMGQDLIGDANGDNLGHSLSLAADGMMLAVGARGHTGNAGLVRVYQFSDEEGLWNQAGQDIEGELAGDRFGFSVSLSADGSTVAAGGDGNNSNGLDSGHVRVYRLVDQEWTLLGQEIEGKSAADQFGVSVSLSSDGSALAVGADQYTDIEALPPGIEAPPGYVCVFRLEDATWLQIGDELVGEEAGENFGSSVSISGDGRTVAVGAYASGQFSGSVRIYSLEDDAAVGA